MSGHDSIVSETSVLFVEVSREKWTSLRRPNPMNPSFEALQIPLLDLVSASRWTERKMLRRFEALMKPGKHDLEFRFCEFLNCTYMDNRFQLSGPVKGNHLIRGKREWVICVRIIFESHRIEIFIHSGVRIEFKVLCVFCMSWQHRSLTLMGTLSMLTHHYAILIVLLNCSAFAFLSYVTFVSSIDPIMLLHV